MSTPREGTFSKDGFDYSYQVDTDNNQLILKTYDKDANMQIEIVCRESSDTEQRWQEFQRLMAKTAADYLLKRSAEKRQTK